MIKKSSINFVSQVSRDSKIIFAPNQGNAGDSLIAHATFRQLKEKNVPYTLYEKRKVYPGGSTLVYGGGGNLTKNYNYAAEIIGEWRVSNPNSDIIILPHTINCHEELIDSFGDRCTVFAREKVTYDFLLRKAKSVKIYLDHDLAFSLDPRKTINEHRRSFFGDLLLKIYFKSIGSPCSSNIPQISKQVKNLKFEYERWLCDRKENPRKISCFRTDSEITGPIGLGNFDLSEIYNYGALIPTSAEFASYKLLRFLDNFDEISTNRLHVCVAGALLEKKVFFYPNSYFKNRAVFDYSIQDRFPNVVFQEK